MKITRAFLPVLCLSATLCHAQDLHQQGLRLVANPYQEVHATAEELADTRRFGEGHQLWLSAVPDDEKTAADYFLLGNVMFGPVPEKSLELYQKAAELDPESATIQLQLAMALHRNGQFERAIPAYQAYINSDTAKQRGPGVFGALLADCLIRTGRYEQAVDAWADVPFRSFRVQIARFVHTIHGPPSVHQRHYDLLTAARENDLDSAAQAILLDARWDPDWWSVDVNRDFLEADIQEFRDLFPHDDQRLQLMVAIADYHLAEPKDPATFATSLREADLIIGDSPAIPPHGLLVSHAVRILLDHDIATADQLLEAHEATFRAELDRPENELDVELINVYAHLLAQSNKPDQLEDLDRLVWQKTGDARFAASYLATCVRDGKTSDDPDVAAIIEQFPTHQAVSTIALSLATEEEQPLTEPLANAIAAEFESLTEHPIGGHRTSDRLNELFEKLRQTLSD